MKTFFVVVYLGVLCVFAAMLLGCAEDAGGFDPKPGQTEAVAMALATYGAPVNMPLPPIGWKEGAELNCAGNLGPGWIDDSGTCVDGQFTEGTPFAHWQIWLADKGGAMSATGLDHELGHVALLNMTGDSDQRHMGPMFCDVGQVGPCLATNGMQRGLVAKAIKLTVAARL